MKALSLLPLLAFSIACGSLAVSAPDQGFEKKEFAPSSGDTLRYAVLAPESAEAGTRYPLVLSLHGVGGRGKSDWERNCYANTALSQPEMRSKYPCFVVAPTCEARETWGNLGRLEGKERTLDLVDLIEKLLTEMPIDPNRIYITGQSMGGVGTFALVKERPDLFAAAVPICGGHLPENATRMKTVPFWVFHGARDKTVPVDLSREMVQAIQAAGGEANYTEFPEMGHSSWRPAYNTPELWKWLFAQKRTP